MKHKIVCQNDDFLIVNKQHGVSVQNDQQHEGSLLGLIKEQEKLSELYLVHRLDKVTSGLIILAKHKQANAELSALFRDKAVEKYYIAISPQKLAKKLVKKQGVVKGDMEAARRGAWRLLRSCENPAVTQFISAGSGGLGRVFLIKPKTGKTHQIRVALKSLAAPIIGDALYGTPDAKLSDRVYLHAYALRFSFQGKEWSFVEPPEQGEIFAAATVQDLIKGWVEPWSKFKL